MMPQAVNAWTAQAIAFRISRSMFRCPPNLVNARPFPQAKPAPQPEHSQPGRPWQMGASEVRGAAGTAVG